MANVKRGKISDRVRDRLTMLCGHADCRYASTLVHGMCDYLCVTGKLRGCPPTKDCNKYEGVGMGVRTAYNGWNGRNKAMEFKEIAKEYKRMCDSYIGIECGTQCERCEILNKLKYQDQRCETWIMNHPDEAEEIISKWAKEHPVRTYLRDFKEKYPKSTYFNDGICRKRLYGQIKALDKCAGDDCEECWRQELQE